MSTPLRRPAPPILILLWRKTADCWRIYGRRFEMLAHETEASGYHADESLRWRREAANAYALEKRALEKADSLERGGM